MRDRDLFQTEVSPFELRPSLVHDSKLDCLVVLATLLAGISSATILGLQMIGAI